MLKRKTDGDGRGSDDADLNGRPQQGEGPPAPGSEGVGRAVRETGELRLTGVSLLTDTPEGRLRVPDLTLVFDAQGLTVFKGSGEAVKLYPWTSLSGLGTELQLGRPADEVLLRVSSPDRSHRFVVSGQDRAGFDERLTRLAYRYRPAPGQPGEPAAPPAGSAAPESVPRERGAVPPPAPVVSAEWARHWTNRPEASKEGPPAGQAPEPSAPPSAERRGAPESGARSEGSPSRPEAGGAAKPPVARRLSPPPPDTPGPSAAAGREHPPPVSGPPVEVGGRGPQPPGRPGGAVVGPAGGTATAGGARREEETGQMQPVAAPEQPVGFQPKVRSTGRRILIWFLVVLLVLVLAFLGLYFAQRQGAIDILPHQIVTPPASSSSPAPQSSLRGSVAASSKAAAGPKKAAEGVAVPATAAKAPAPPNVIAQMTVGELSVIAAGQGFSCTPVGTSSFNCTRLSQDAVLHVTSPNGQGVSMVALTVLGPPGSAEPGLLQSVASVPYQGAAPQQASQWVSANLQQSAGTTIGPVSFQLVVLPDKTLLELSRGGSQAQ